MNMIWGYSISQKVIFALLNCNVQLCVFLNAIMSSDWMGGYPVF